VREIHIIVSSRKDRSRPGIRAASGPAVDNKAPWTLTPSIVTTMSRKGVMNRCAAAVIAALPTAGAPALIFSDPASAKNAATLDAHWLHQAALYLVPNSCNFAASIVAFIVPRAAGAAENIPALRTHIDLALSCSGLTAHLVRPSSEYSARPK